MNQWFRRRWVAFQSSYEPAETAEKSNPAAIVVGAGGVAAVMAVVGFVPFVASSSQMRLPFLPIGAILLGALATYTTYRHKATGPIGTACPLIDTALYTSGLALASILSTGNYAIAFAVSLGLFQITFPGATYGFTLLISLAMCAPPLVLAAVLHAPASVQIIMWIGSALALSSCHRTAKTRALVAQNRNLRSVLGETSQAADESLEIAVSVSLLDIGHFLHELRNLQGHQRMNLHFLAEAAQFDEPCRDAVRDLLDARDSEERLIGQALDDIRGRTARKLESFDLLAVIEQAIEDNRDWLPMSALCSEPSVHVIGNTRHLLLVIANLARNAAQAGARSAKIEVRTQGEDTAVRVEFTDDGPGIPPEMMDTLFAPFSTARNGTGTGLGLYLVRRYVELMGGRVEAANVPEGGARFSLRLLRP